MITLLIVIFFLALLLLGVPIFVVISGLTLYLLFSNQIDISALIIEMHRMATTPVLVAIPLFTFAGYLLSASGAPQRLIRLSNAVLGWLPGGLSVIALITCAVFTALTGATGLTIIALGGILLPAMMRGRYSEMFSLGLLTTSGTLGLLFPPSLPLIIYAIVAKVRIDHLFVAGLLPGLLLILLLAGFCIFKSVRTDVPQTRFQLKELGAAAREMLWELPLPFVVLGGIYSGYFAVSEAAAITAVYVLIAEVFIYRDIRFGQLPEIMKKSMILVGGILIILGAAMGLTNYLVDSEIPLRLFSKPIFKVGLFSWWYSTFFFWRLAVPWEYFRPWWSLSRSWHLLPRPMVLIQSTWVLFFWPISKSEPPFRPWASTSLLPACVLKNRS